LDNIGHVLLIQLTILTTKLKIAYAKTAVNENETWLMSTKLMLKLSGDTAALIFMKPPIRLGFVTEKPLFEIFPFLTPRN
jgi:hypothetical protein